MDPQQDLLQATEDFRRRLAIDAEPDEGPAGEYKASEYIIFLLALDVYVRHMEETIEFHLGQKQEQLEQGVGDPKALEQEIAELERHVQNPTDKVIKAGVRLLRRLDRDLATFQKFMSDNLPGQAHQTMLTRALRRPARNTEGAGLRAQSISGLLGLGGAKTTRALFDSQRARKQINEARAAARLEDGDAALDKFAAMTVKNALIRKWLSWAAKEAKPLMGEGVSPDQLEGREQIVNPIEQAATETSEQAPKLMAQQVEQMAATGAEEVQAAQQAQQETLAEVELSAATVAREALDKSGEPDEPPARSEVVGIATAAAVAATADVSNPRNIPETLKDLDEEQRAAALTDGKVLIAAGAGAGKSRTLVARANYLIRERGVDSGRILVTSFNKKAATELKEKLGEALGSGAPKHVGTMHSMFSSFVRKYGSPREAAALNNPAKVEGATSRAVQGMWKDCYPDDSKPAAKKMLLAKSQWSGNNVSPRDALEMAVTPEEVQAARWYEMYEGLKGGLDQVHNEGTEQEEVVQWESSCEAKAQEAVDDFNDGKIDQWRSMGSNPKYKPTPKKTVYESFMAKSRPGGKRIGDFDDQLRICHDVMERDEGARKAIQARFDHVMVDECQDLNEVQHGVIRMMTEHITDGADGRSLWMVGDDKQSIYAFRGARPDLFTSLDGKEGWTTRVIRTNYRCAPEIVDAANKLIAHNSGQIPMEANPSPAKTRGEGSIRVQEPENDAQAAIQTIEEIKLHMLDTPESEHGDFLRQNAILLRTNKEAHAFETACIIRGIPYARKGNGSFLGSRETGAMLGYMNMIMGGDDPKKMQTALVNCINEPNRFYSGSQTEAKVETAVRDYAQKAGIYIKDADPSKLIHDREFQEVLADSFGGGSWRSRKALEKIQEMAYNIRQIQMVVDEPDFTTKDLFDEILGSFEGETESTDANGVPVKTTQTLRESLQTNVSDFGGDEDEEAADEEDEIAKLGNIGFLYLLMEPDPTDPGDTVQSPRTPAGFKAKMARLSERADDLRYNLDWNPKTGDKNDKMASLSPADRKKPPAVYLGTVHSVKGAEWPNVYVQMPGGKFPYEPPPPGPDDPPIDEAEMKRREEDLETERRLGYVALTRAESKLTVICPKKVGGKPSGISPFVGEAGLVIGENVGREREALAEPETETMKLGGDLIGQTSPEGLAPWDPSDFEGGA